MAMYQLSLAFIFAGLFMVQNTDGECDTSKQYKTSVKAYHSTQEKLSCTTLVPQIDSVQDISFKWEEKAKSGDGDWAEVTPDKIESLQTQNTEDECNFEAFSLLAVSKEVRQKADMQFRCSVLKKDQVMSRQVYQLSPSRSGIVGAGSEDGESKEGSKGLLVGGVVTGFVATAFVIHIIAFAIIDWRDRRRNSLIASADAPGDMK